MLDRATGEQRYFEINAGGKGSGAHLSQPTNSFILYTLATKGTRAFDLVSGLKTAFMPNEPVLAGDYLYSAEMDKEKPIVRAYGADQKVAWRSRQTVVAILFKRTIN